MVPDLHLGSVMLTEEIPMYTALAAYLSDMPESEKLAIVRAQWLPCATMLDSITGSEIVQTWNEE